MVTQAETYVNALSVSDGATQKEPRISDAEMRQQRIAWLAYSKAEKRGFEPGYELGDWLEAEAEVI